jgi:hypothetical protein
MLQNARANIKRSVEYYSMLEMVTTNCDAKDDRGIRLG